MATSDGAAFRRVLDLLGREIVGGASKPGDPGTVDAIVARTGASRPVVREATRVLVSLGMLTASPKVGLQVQARTEWDLLDPQLIRWRLESPDREAQLTELRGVRLAIELEAVRRAAQTPAGSQADGLHALVDEMSEAVARRDGEAFLRADRRFHRLLQVWVGNPMLLRLDGVIDEALGDRVPATSARWGAAPGDVALHREVVVAIRGGDGERAASIMRRIVEAGGNVQALGSAPKPSLRVGVLGVGAMGEPIARALLEAGHPVTVHGRRRARLESLVGAGARWADSPKEVAERSSVILSMLPDLPPLDEMLKGPRGLIAGIAESTTIIVGSTSSADAVRELATQLTRRTHGLVSVVDAPVSGGVEGAVARRLAIMVGGSEDDVARVLPVLESYGTPVHLGPLGAGEIAKAVNQMVVGTAMMALAEATVVAERSGLDIGRLLDLLAGGYAGSRILEAKRSQLVSGEYSTAGKAVYMAKDLAFAGAAAQRTATATPILAAAQEAYGRLVAAGLGELDLAVAKRYIELGAP